MRRLIFIKIVRLAIAALGLAQETRYFRLLNIGDRQNIRLASSLLGKVIDHVDKPVNPFTRYV